MVTTGVPGFATLLLILVSARPVPGFFEPQAVEAREIVLDRERQELAKKQQQEKLENWDRAVRRIVNTPPPGGPAVDIEELRIPEKARRERDAAWHEFQKNRLDRAEKKATKAIAVCPDFPAAYLVRGEIRIKSGRAEAAEQDFKKAVALRPDAGWIPEAIAATYLRNERPDMALIRINDAIANTGENNASLSLKGQAEFMLRRFGEAELSFRRSLALKSGNHLAVFYIARICCISERYDEALLLLRPLLSERDLSVDRLQVVALISHAERMRSSRSRVTVPK